MPDSQQGHALDLLETDGPFMTCTSKKVDGGLYTEDGGKPFKELVLFEWPSISLVGRMWEDGWSLADKTRYRGKACWIYRNGEDYA